MRSALSKENVEMVRRGVELWNTAGHADEAGWNAAMEEMLAAYHPDAALDFSRTTIDFPPTRGRDAMIAWTEATRPLMSEVCVEATEFIDAGETVVVAMRISATGSASGVGTSMEYAYVFQVAARQIVAATTYKTLSEALSAVEVE
jgi:ketosteroid isomerase-like protein